MTRDEERAVEQYKGNPLAKTFVDFLHEQIGIRPTPGSVLMVLSHPGLLTMLELGHEQMSERTRAELLSPAKPNIYLRS